MTAATENALKKTNSYVNRYFILEFRIYPGLFSESHGLRTIFSQRFIPNKPIYYMALSHKDWELPNARIWLAEMDIDRGLDFPI